MDGMITPNLVISYPFVFTWVLIFVETMAKDFLQWLEIFSFLIIIILCRHLSFRGTWSYTLIFLNSSNLAIFNLVDFINQAFKVLHIEVKLLRMSLLPRHFDFTWLFWQIINDLNFLLTIFSTTISFYSNFRLWNIFLWCIWNEGLILVKINFQWLICWFSLV